jgi:hypothetical protein
MEIQTQIAARAPLPQGSYEGRHRLDQRLEKLLKLLAIQITITKNLGEQPRPKNLAGVNPRYRRTAIGVMKKMMTAFDAEYFKTSLLQSRQ